MYRSPAGEGGDAGEGRVGLDVSHHAFLVHVPGLDPFALGSHQPGETEQFLPRVSTADPLNQR